MVEKPFNYTPSPAVLAPIEYTIVKEKYAKIGGHIKAIRKMEDVLKETVIRWLGYRINRKARF